MKTVLIGSLYETLSVIEAEKGKAKLAEKTAKGLQAPFVALSGSEDTRFVTATGQEAASVKFQTRATVSVEMLLEAGVSPEVIAAATVESAPFAVFRIH